MSEYRGVGGVAREITKKYRGVGGVAREVATRYRGVGGVARPVFENKVKIARAHVVVSDSSGQSNKRFTSNGYWHDTSTETYWFYLVLNLYDSNGNLIEYETLDDIDGLESFRWNVSTLFEFYATGVDRNDSIFGHNPFTYEDVSQDWYWPGEFTITKDNFKEKYIRAYHGYPKSFKITVEFGPLYINGESIPFSFSEW